MMQMRNGFFVVNGISTFESKSERSYNNYSRGPQILASPRAPETHLGSNVKLLSLSWAGNVRRGSIRLSRKLRAGEVLT